MSSYQITTIVATYNSDIKETIRTLRSIIRQRDIQQQVIVADDGSHIDVSDDIRRFFKEEGFKDFIIINGNENVGTVKSLYRAVLQATGEYMKPISPGDYFHNPYMLSNWYRYMLKHGISVSFGNAVYYDSSNGEMCLMQRKVNQPVERSIYEERTYSNVDILVNNLVLSDNILGATYLATTTLVRDYLKELIDRVRLCEDFAYRLMLLDGIPIVHYDNPVIYYSYGTGVTKKKKADGRNLLADDADAFNSLLVSRLNDRGFQRRLRYYLLHIGGNNVMNRLLSFVIFPRALYNRLSMSMIKKNALAWSTTDIDMEFLEEIGVSCEGTDYASD